ncbi:predicted protein [Methanosarcina acetivorans C2A]|uniref:Uncharacterized protein n=1 Tax=Methanosarcina acetivorans (strain ATCC 35395 / DSM 2834 / JCM 12185 / C2A) TaxID=188937 RepID=Q8TJE9_METAC|nr:predicted protein [Methanosarcina acetivorans C2A]
MMSSHPRKFATMASKTGTYVDPKIHKATDSCPVVFFAVAIFLAICSNIAGTWSSVYSFRTCFPMYTFPTSAGTSSRRSNLTVTFFVTQLTAGHTVHDNTPDDYFQRPGCLLSFKIVKYTGCYLAPVENLRRLAFTRQLFDSIPACFFNFLVEVFRHPEGASYHVFFIDPATFCAVAVRLLVVSTFRCFILYHNFTSKFFSVLTPLPCPDLNRGFLIQSQE